MNQPIKINWLIKQLIRKHYHKALGTNVIKSPLSPLSEKANDENVD